MIDEIYGLKTDGDGTYRITERKRTEYRRRRVLEILGANGWNTLESHDDEIKLGDLIAILEYVYDVEVTAIIPYNPRRVGDATDLPDREDIDVEIDDRVARRLEGTLYPDPDEEE